MTFAALGVPPIRNIVIQFTLAVANDKVLMANLSLLDVACERHNNCGIRLVLPSVCRREPSWGLTLDQLWVFAGDTV